MNQDRHKRKMSAIFSADVVGYSRLMEADEAWTIKSIEENKSLISNLIEEYHGRVVDAPGDNILAEFSSVTNAVECAVNIQKELKTKNSKLMEEQRMEFRIGINLGEIVEEGGRIYGSGVNIAARIEGLSKSGGICISGRTYDHIKTRFDFGYEFLGEHNVKNISEPIRVYRLLLDYENAGKVIGDKKAPSRSSYRIAITAVIVLIIIAAISIGWNIHSRKTNESVTITEQAPVATDLEEALKTIAVLPFDDLSPEKDQEHFVLGLSEEILNSLCQISDLGVAGKTSSFSFKGSKKTIQQIANDLGVDHILEGSVRKAGNDLRITAQLVQAADGLHLWSKTYDRELKDIFEVQENIASSVAHELKVTLGIGKPLKQLGGTDNLEAYELYLVAKGIYHGGGLFEVVLESVDKAIELDPEFALAWVFKCLLQTFHAGGISPDQASLELDAALEAALRAIELEPSLGQAYLTLGLAHLYRGEFIEAGLAYQKGVELTTEITDYAEYGLPMHYSIVGYLRKNNELLEEMRRKDPLQPILRAAYMLNLGYLGDMERAEEEYKRGKTIFGDQWIYYGNFNIFLLRLGTKDVLPINEIPEIRTDGPIYTPVREHLNSPEKGLEELRRLYNSDENKSSMSFMFMTCWAAYFGDPEFALNAMERAVDISAGPAMFQWTPVLREVRQLPRYKEFVKEIGLVDYWKRFGWPDFCRSIGDDDFECD